MISTPSTSPEPIETKENESPSSLLSCSPHKSSLMTSKTDYELSRESMLSSPGHQLFAQQPKNNFPISSLISSGVSNRVSSADFLNSSSLMSNAMSNIRHPFYLPNQSGVSFFDRNPFLREFSIPSHFVPPFSSIKTSLFNAFNEKYVHTFAYWYIWSHLNVFHFLVTKKTDQVSLQRTLTVC